MASAAIKELIKSAKRTDGKHGLPPTGGGFDLEIPETVRFDTLESFQKCLVAQRDALAAINAKDVDLKHIDAEGRVKGTDYRLSMAAFGDLCNFSKMPVSFLKRLCRFDEQLALDVVASCVDSTFFRGTLKTLLIDSRCGRIEGIVGSDSYKPLPNADVLEYSLSADKELKFGHGWLNGPHMRMVAINDLRPVEPKKGDVVKLGMSLESAINGDHSVRVATYCERLVCTNGMVRRDKDYCHSIRHSGDVKINVGQAIVHCADNAKSFVPLMHQAAIRTIGPEDIPLILNFVADTRNGGNETLKKRVIALAQTEATSEGRDQYHLTLWNFTNAVTACAHEAKTIQRKTEIESLGFKLLDRFQSVN